MKITSSLFSSSGFTFLPGQGPALDNLFLAIFRYLGCGILLGSGHRNRSYLQAIRFFPREEKVCEGKDSLIIPRPSILFTLFFSCNRWALNCWKLLLARAFTGKKINSKFIWKAKSAARELSKIEQLMKFIFHLSWCKIYQVYSTCFYIHPRSSSWIVKSNFNFRNEWKLYLLFLP